MISVAIILVLLCSKRIVKTYRYGVVFVWFKCEAKMSPKRFTLLLWYYYLLYIL